MRLIPFFIVFLAAAPASAQEISVALCIEYFHDRNIQNAAEDAKQILQGAGVQTEWYDISSCPNEKAPIRIRLSGSSSKYVRPGALAYTAPKDGTWIQVYFDRVLAESQTYHCKKVAGYVLSHEIVHILQAQVHHSPDGIMKAKWNRQDYAKMRDGQFSFNPLDLVLIRDGTIYRAEHGAGGAMGQKAE